MDACTRPREPSWVPEIPPGFLRSLRFSRFSALGAQSRAGPMLSRNWGSAEAAADCTLNVPFCRHVLWGAMVGNVCCASLWDESRFQWKMDDVCCVAVGCGLVWLQSSSWKTRTRAVPVSLCSWIAGFHQSFVDDFSIFFH